jgi:hypothetical protein
VDSTRLVSGIGDYGTMRPWLIKVLSRGRGLRHVLSQSKCEGGVVNWAHGSASEHFPTGLGAQHCHAELACPELSRRDSVSVPTATI